MRLRGGMVSHGSLPGIALEMGLAARWFWLCPRRSAVATSFLEATLRRKGNMQATTTEKSGKCRLPEPCAL